MRIDGVIVSKSRLMFEASALDIAIEQMKCGRNDRALVLIEQARTMIMIDVGLVQATSRAEQHSVRSPN